MLNHGIRHESGSSGFSFVRGFYLLAGRPIASLPIGRLIPDGRQAPGVDATHQTGQSNCSRSLITKKLIFASLLYGGGFIPFKSAHRSIPSPWTLIRHLLIPWLGCASAEGKCDPPDHHEGPRIARHSLPVQCSLLRSHCSIMVATREHTMNEEINLIF